MRGVLVMALVASACSFGPGVGPADAPVDTKPDVILPTWQMDATSKKAVPAATFEWTELFRAYGLTMPPPDNLWLMQETSGSLSDSIGSITLNPVNSPTYTNAISGWTRSAVGTSDIVANQGFITASTGNLNGPSYLILVYVAVLNAPATERALLGLGADTDHRFVSVTPAPVFKGTGFGGVTPGFGTVNPMATVHPILLKLAASKLEYVVYTDQEKIPVSWTGTGGIGGLFMFGNATSMGAASARYLYGALWTGSSAAVTDADAKKLLQALGWTVTGY